MTTIVTNNPTESRYEIHADGELAAFVTYRVAGDVVDLRHAETVAGFEGRGMAAALVAGTFDDIRSHSLKMRPSCPYVASYLERHPDQRDLVAD